MEGRLGRALGAAKRFLMSVDSPTPEESGAEPETRIQEAINVSQENRYIELTPRKLDIGFGGSRVVGVDRKFNEYLASRGANFDTTNEVMLKGNKYVYGFFVGGRLVITQSTNYPYKINK